MGEGEGDRHREGRKRERWVSFYAILVCINLAQLNEGGFPRIPNLAVLPADEAAGP